jgi:hypothetical protein
MACLDLVCMWQSAWWLSYGDRAAGDEREVEALDAWRAAASWQAPINPWRKEALSRLAQRSQPRALYRLRGAILESSLVPIGNDGRLLLQASRRLAGLRPGLHRALWIDVPPKFSWWKVLAILSLIALIFAGYALIRVSSRVSLNRQSVILALTVYWAALALISLGLHFSP